MKLACCMILGFVVPWMGFRLSDDPTPQSGALAIELGLTPEAVAASGLADSDASAMLVRLDAAIEQLGILNATTSALDAAIADVVAMDEILRQQPWDDETLIARESLAATVPGLQADVDTAKTALIATALQGMESEARARVERCLAASGSSLPASMRVYPMTAAERRVVEAALTAERRATQMGCSLSQSASSTLSACRSHTDVAAACVSLSANLSAIQAVYAGGEPE